MGSEMCIRDSYAALSINAKAIISFDKHFDNLKIPRKEPKDIIEMYSK